MMDMTDINSEARVKELEHQIYLKTGLNLFLRERVADLEKALKPFAEYGERVNSDSSARHLGDSCPIRADPGMVDDRVTLGDCRYAAKILKDK